jgi:hypothetical protein
MSGVKSSGGSRRCRVKNARTESEIVEALEDVEVTLEIVVAHLGVQDQVNAAVEANRAKAERSRIEIERSLGHSIDDEEDPRR